MYIKHTYLCLERCFLCLVLIFKGGRGIKGSGNVVNQYVIGNMGTRPTPGRP